MREGMTLHQWLRRAIADHASANGVDPATLDHEERATAIMERLNQAPETKSNHLTAVDQHAERETAPSGAPASNKVDDMLQDLAKRLGDKPRTTTRQQTPRPPARTKPASEQRAEHQSALQEALREALRVARREPESKPAPEPRPAPTTAAPRTRSIQEMADPAPLARNIRTPAGGALRQEIDQLSHHIADLQQRDREPVPHNGGASDRTMRANQDREASQDTVALRRLSAKTDEIRDLVASVITRPAQTSKIERQLDLLGARIDELASSASTVHEATELSRGINDIRSLLNHGATPGQLDALDRKLDQLSRKVDTALSEAASAPQFDDLARRIDNVHRRVETNASIMAKADTSAIERMMLELARKLDQPAPRIEIPAPNFAPVESELRRLSNKMDAIAAHPENPVLDGLRRDVTNLSARVDAVSAAVQSANTFASQTNAESFEVLRKEVASLSGRMDQIAASATEVSVLDGLQSQIELLVDRIEALPRREMVGVQSLEAQIVKLADKIDAISAPSREETMLAELQTEIARLAKQFGATPSESSAPALAMLEQVRTHLATIPKRAAPMRTAETPESAVDKSISDLFQQIQELREAAQDTVEAAEHQAAVDAKPQTPAQTPAVDEALKRELSDLRQQQEAADRRTTETLSAVHQTLEKLVGRLCDLESDLIEVRPEPVAAAVKAQPTPPAPPAPRKEPVVEAPTAAPKVEQRPEPVSAPEPQRARKAGPGAVLSNQASFIAAARRAANETQEQPQPKAALRLGDLLTQISGRNAEIVAHPATTQAPEAAADHDQGALGALRRALGARRRTVLIALAGLVVILGSLQALRTSRSGEAPAAALSGAPNTKLAIAPAAPAAPAPAPGAAVQAPAAASEPALPEAAIAAPTNAPAPGFTPPLASSGFDLAPTGGVGVQPGQSLADAAGNGLASAQYEMGVRLADGRGMAQDNQAARQWLELAAKQNLPPAQYRLGAMLERGIGGAKDVKRAQDLYAKAAAQGHVRAMHNMGVLSAEGAEGKPDYVAAASWFRKAADFGLRDSQYNLAILYARGMGVEKNLPVSWAWFTAATAQGDIDSAQKREEIAARLTPTQMAAAKAMVEAYRARTPDPASNEVTTPPGGWDTLSVTNTPKASAPAQKAKVSKL